MRFNGKLPSATLLPVASFLSAIGTTTSLVTPLSVSFPAISYLSPPTFLIEVELRLRLRQVLRQEHDVGLPLAKPPLDIDAQLLGHEADLALVDQQALCASLAGSEQERPERR